MNNKFIKFFCVCAVIFFAMVALRAEERHKTVRIVENTTNIYQSNGTALSDAFSQIDCNFSSKKWHGGIGLGFNEDYTAPAVGICKRFQSVLIKGTLGKEHGKNRGGIGVIFQFE